MKTALFTLAMCAALTAHAQAQANSEPQIFQRTPSSDRLVADATDTPTAAIPDRRPTPFNQGGITHDRMMWDAPGDGSLWARGATYKASFDARGAIFYPAFGSKAPRTMPHSLSPDVVTLGGAPIAFDREASATRDGDRVQFERGAFNEVYDLALGSMEQSFVFDTLPLSGDLVLHIPVGSELEARQGDSGIEFRGEFGRVTYGRATAIDAAGQRTPASTTIEDGAITIRVDAGFLAHAALPLVIDPIVGGLPIPNGPLDYFSADISFDTFNQVWLTVYEEKYSATDSDVFCAMHNTGGTLINTGTIDLSSEKWEAPRCAYNTAPHQFLVVAGVTSGSTQSIKGRTAAPAGATISIGSPFVVSVADAGAKTAPDVGADSYPIGPTVTNRYCVAYTHANPSGYTEIGISMILTDTSIVQAYYLPGAGSFASDSQVSVSKSDDGDQFLLAWQRFDGTGHGDIYGAHLDFLGDLADGPFGITSFDPAVDGHPCASSPITGTHQSIVTYQRAPVLSTNHDIWVTAIDGTTILDSKDLITLEGTGLEAVDQIEPSIECDGRHFLVAYSEFYASWSTYLLWADDLYLSGGVIDLRQTHDLLHYDVTYNTHRANIAAMRNTSAWDGHYGVVFDTETSGPSHDVFAILYDTVDGGATSSFCSGDGSGTACPCGNAGFSGYGCANSVNASGATLYVSSGLASTLQDNLHIQCSGMPSGVACLFFQGTALLTGAPFGDGLRCVGGSIVRLATKTATGGIATYPEPIDHGIVYTTGIPIDGGTRGYQAWYRNAASFCTASTFNLSNGLRVDWTR